MNSDLLDQYCKAEFGHDDWAIHLDEDGNTCVTFSKREYEDEPSTWVNTPPKATDYPIYMRKDLAEEGITIPAGLSYSDYDNLEDVIHLSVADLVGATEYDMGDDPDNHCFSTVQLSDGRIVYMYGVDLEWFDRDDVTEWSDKNA